MLIEDLEADVRAALAERASQVPAQSAARVRQIDYHPRAYCVRPRFAVGAAAGALAVAVTAAAILIIGLGAGTPAAFAGWTPTPSRASDLRLAGAEAACTHRPAGAPSFLPADARPVLTEARGPFTVVIFSGADFTATCVTGPTFASMSSSGGPGVGTVPAGRIRLSSSHATTRDGDAFTVVVGHVGADVSATTLRLGDGTSVQATIEHGWFAAWWPGGQDVGTAELTTPSGTKSVHLDTRGPVDCGPGPCTKSTGGGGTSVGVEGG